MPKAKEKGRGKQKTTSSTTKPDYTKKRKIPIDLNRSISSKRRKIAKLTFLSFLTKTDRLRKPVLPDTNRTILKKSRDGANQLSFLF